MGENPTPSVDKLLDQNVLDLLEVKVTRAMQERFLLLPTKWVLLVLAFFLVAGGFSGWLAVREAARNALEGQGAQRAIDQLKKQESEGSAILRQLQSQANALNSGVPVDTVLPYVGDLETEKGASAQEAALDGRLAWAKGAPNWIVCNGSAILVDGKSRSVPDLRDRFLKGVRREANGKVEWEGGSNGMQQHTHDLRQCAGAEHFICIVGPGTGVAKLAHSAIGKPSMADQESLASETGGVKIKATTGKATEEYSNAPLFKSVFYIVRVR